MGNCQAAEATTVLIQHPVPGDKVERVYWAISASEVMASNPGHYVAIVLSRPPNSSPPSPSSSTPSAKRPQRYLKLLRPGDKLQIGHVYRLVSFEEVLKELTTKRHVKLSRLLLTQHKEVGSGKGVRDDADAKIKKMERGARRVGGSAGVETSTERVPTVTIVTQDAANRHHHPQHPHVEAVEAEEKVEEHAVVGAAGMSLLGTGGSMGQGMGRRHGGHWRPALQSIAECS